jgi:hypothetical protein
MGGRKTEEESEKARRSKEKGERVRQPSRAARWLGNPIQGAFFLKTVGGMSHKTNVILLLFRLTPTLL